MVFNADHGEASSESRVCRQESRSSSVAALKKAASRRIELRAAATPSSADARQHAFDAPPTA
jgi:hypothetical protein